MGGVDEGMDLPRLLKINKTHNVAKTLPPSWIKNIMELAFVGYNIIIVATCQSIIMISDVCWNQ